MKIDRTKLNNIIGTRTNAAAVAILEVYMEKIRIETLGWALAESCLLLDSGKDPRTHALPKSLEDYKRDFEK